MTHTVRSRPERCIAVSGGASAQSTAFSSQTYWDQGLRYRRKSNATNDGARIKVGDSPVASATSTLLPLNWVEWIKCTPGQKIAVVGNNASTGSLSITELTD